MAIKEEYIDFQELWLNSDGDKIIVNDLNSLSLTDKNILFDNLMTVYDKDVISVKPSCDCGYYNKRYRLGKTCPKCGSVSQEPSKKVKPVLWLKSLHHNVPFINPTFWLKLRTILEKKSIKKSKIDYVRWLSDSRYNPPIKNIPPYIKGLNQMLNGKRDYFALIENIENIISYLLEHSSFKDYDNQVALTLLLKQYESNKNIIYTNILPIVNRKMFVMENTSMGKFTNLAVSDVIDVVTSWVKATDNTSPLSKDKLSYYTVKAVSKLANNYRNNMIVYLLDKPGAIRKHGYGARSSFTFRSVISSVIEPIPHDEVHVPWSIAVTAFRPHLLNKLTNKLKYSHKRANKVLFKCVKAYDPVIHELLDELLAEAPNGRIPIILHRNPSLLQGSTLFVYIGKFKTDPEDKTLGISRLIVKPPNADFDGDELNVQILLDEYMAELFHTLKPFFNIPTLDKPFNISGNLTLLGPGNGILSNYLSDKTENPEKDTVLNKLLYTGKL